MTHPGLPRPPDAPPPTRSRASLYLGLGAGALAIAAGILAIVMLMDGGPSGGLASREDVVRKSFAALTAGDSDALAKLMMSVETRLGLMECKGPMPPVSQKKLDQQRAALEAAVAAAKGTTIEVVAIGKDDAPKVEKKGQPVGNDCTSKFDVSQHEFDVTIKIAQGDGKPVEQKIPVQLWEVDGTWYLPQPPPASLAAGEREDEGTPAGSCDAVGRAYDTLKPEIIAMLKQHGVHAGEQAFTEDRAQTLEFCREDRWPASVIECTAKASSVVRAGGCMNMLPAALVAKYKDAAEALVKKFSRPGGGDDTAHGPHCTEYKKVVERLATCSKVPELERDSHRRRMEATLKFGGMSNPYLDAEQRNTRRQRWERNCRSQVLVISELGRDSCGW